MFQVDKEKCVGCGVCVNACPQEAISMLNDKAWVDPNKCIDCGRCAQVCPQGVIYPGAPSQQSFSSSQGQMFAGRGMGRGLGRGSRDGRGPRDGRGRGAR